MPIAEQPAVQTLPQPVQAIEQSFPGAVADSSEGAKADLLNEVPADHLETRQKLEDTTSADLPDSMTGFFGQEQPWVIPGTDDLVALDVSKDSGLGGRETIGQNIWQYEGGEPGTRTAFQELPAQNVRVFKTIDAHTAAVNAPTELRFTFERGCSGFVDRQCASEDCGFMGMGDCTKAWILREGSYLGTEGVLLVDPNDQTSPGSIADVGSPKVFLTAPVAYDANQNPVRVEWELDGEDAVAIRVFDNEGGVAYPVVVDPILFAARWLVPQTLTLLTRFGVTPLVLVGCAVRFEASWPESHGQVWYRRVWRSTLKCFEGL